jgi:Zn-dependent metalloprotease
VVKSLNGHYSEVEAKTPKISSEEAIEKALNHYQADKYFWEDLKLEQQIKRLRKNQNASYYPEAILEYHDINADLSNPDYRLVYKMHINAIKPYAEDEVLICAETGKVLKQTSGLRTANQAATGASLYYGNVEIMTESNGSGQYVLNDLTRGQGIYTLDNNNGSANFTNNDTIWNLNNSQLDQAAIDAHWGAERFYDYLLDNYNRNGYDDLGSEVYLYVHDGDEYEGAHYNNNITETANVYIGDGTGNQTPYSSLDIIAHELAHAVTNLSSSLIYENESGALNESFSDIIGKTVELIYTDVNSWEMGITTGIPIRSMSNPKAYGQPDTYFGEYWHTSGTDYGGVHVNNSIGNYWYYLLANGGSGTNDNNHNYNITSIGFQKAQELAYNTFTYYLVPSSNYEEAALLSIQASDDLYGVCSEESKTVHNAWFAVGVLPELLEEITADFTLSNSFACYEPFEISFESTTYGGHTYSWDFGDGNTSTEENPLHTFNLAGEYEIKLTAMMENACFSDTNSISQTIVFEALGEPVSTDCTPTPLVTLNNIGINHVKLNTLNHFSGISDEDYNDYTCVANTILHVDSSYTIEVNSSYGSNENVRVWIDFNNNGSFENDELCFSSNNTLYTHTGEIDLSYSNPSLNNPLRMRIISDISSNSSLSPCGYVYNGETEDYSIILIENYSDNLHPVNIDEQLEENNLLSVFPNPTNQFINIEIPYSYKSLKYTLYDIKGNRLLNQESKTKIDISNYDIGVYFLSIEIDGNLQNHKIFKQ